jgi:hypothetical protein
MEEVFAVADVVLANIGRHYSYARGQGQYERGMEVLTQ